MKVNKMIYIEYECIKQMERLAKLHAQNGEKIGIVSNEHVTNE